MVVGEHVTVTVRSEPDKIEKTEYVIKVSAFVTVRRRACVAPRGWLVRSGTNLV